MPNSLDGLVMKFVITSSVLGQYQNALNTTWYISALRDSYISLCDVEINQVYSRV